MFNSVRLTRKLALRRFRANALLLIVLSSVALAGCSGLVTANNGGGGSPPPLTISGVQAATPTTSGFQVSWSTNLAANSAVDYGTTANYGSSTPTNGAMVTSHQVAVTALTPGTLYHFRARSTDASNSSISSADMTFSTAADTTPPTVSITSPAANATISGAVTVSANATDNVGVTSVQFKVDSANTGAAITTAPYNYSLNTNTLSNGNHILTAVASDAGGNTATSAAVTVKVSNTVTTAPSITSLNPTSGPVGTSVTIAGTNFGATQGTSTITFNGTAATATSWSAVSIAAAVPSGATTGNVVVTVGGVASNGVSFTVQADTTPPTVPTGLAATAISSSQINLAWSASTDNVGVTGYNIFRGGVKIGTTPSTSYQDAGLAASTSYTYNISAFDAAGNTSAQSAGASATTQASSGGGGIPSALGWYQVPNTTGPACPSGFSGCANVVAAWSGAIADPTRNRLIVWGGGHTDYNGNEIYSLDLNSLTFARINNPSTPANACVAADPDGNPNSRHTYDGLAYIANQDRMYAFAGSLACAAGSSGIDTWTYSFANNTWQQMDPANGTTPAQIANYQGFGDVADYDPNSGLVFVSDNSSLYSYDYASNTYAKVGSLSQDYHLTGVVDPSRKLFVTVGNGQAHKVDIAPGHGFPSSNLNMSGCGSLLAAEYPGLAYDSVQNLIVAWAGGDTVYLYNPTTDSCTSVTYPNGPGAQQANGTFGRFRYFPSVGVFALVNSWTQNAYTLRLTAPSGSGPAISQTAVSGITTSGATISWTTDVAATSQVEYGTTTAYGTLTTLNSNLVTSHSVALAGLATNTLYHYRVHSKNSSGVESIGGDSAFQTSSGVINPPPTVAITAPANGATVSGTVTVSAAASSSVGIANVQFMLDGANVGTALTASPYQISWDTATAANGSHSLTAAATDTAGNSVTSSPVTVTVSNSSSAAQQDFQARCTAAGVVFCQGFDDASGFQQNVNIYSNSTYPGVFPVQDSTTGRSGTSLRIDVPPFQGSNMGKFDTVFPGIGGNGADFYFQVATRISPEMLSNYQNFGWPTWKNHGFFNGNTSCTGLMVVTGLHNSGLIPVGTAGGCSANGLFTNGGVPPYLLQQGDYNCQYGSVNPTTCFYWPTNTWITFYYHLKLGTLDGSGNFPGTLVEAWVATNGQPYKKWLNLSNFYFVGNGAGAPFNHLELYPYMTGKDPTQGGYPTAHVWYDELIVSSQPIAAPGVPPALP